MPSSQKYVKHLYLSLIKFNYTTLIHTQRMLRKVWVKDVLFFRQPFQFLLQIPKKLSVKNGILKTSLEKFGSCRSNFIHQFQPIRLIIKSMQFLCIILIVLFTPTASQAQFYDTIHRPKLDWFEIQSEHFRIIYHEGLDDLAHRAVQILENRYPEIQNLIGGQLKNYPVIINGYNDSGNGYISTLHFRMEIEAPPISGKILNHVGSDRLDGLLSHELAHALQFSEFGTTGFTRFISIFSPDIARSNHGLSPPGFREGLATYVESELNPQIGGRGNFAPFTNQFYQNINDQTPWNLGQLLTPSSIYRPVDRYYIGGYHFTNWLIKTQKPDLIESSLKSFANFPLLGYAPHLWYHTGKSPRALYREFIQFETQKFDSISVSQNHQFRSKATRQNITYPGIATNNTISSNESSTRSVTSASFAPDQHTPSQPYQIFENTSLDGSNSYNPVWINDDEIIYYSTSYNGRPGFYSLNITDDSHKLLFETRIDESFHFELSPDKQNLLYSRYHTHLIYDNHYTTDVHEVNLNSKKSNRITKNERVRIPGYLNDTTLVALQTKVDSHQPVIIQKSISGHFSQNLPPTENVPLPESTLQLHPAKSTHSKNPQSQTLQQTSLSHLTTASSTNFVQISINPAYKIYPETNSSNSINTPRATTKTININQTPSHPVSAASKISNNSTSLPVSAAIITVDNQSGIYFSYDGSDPIPNIARGPEIHILNSSIYDLSWSPDGKKLLFSADFQNTMQLFEYNVEQNTLHQLTQGPWNSMEASYSVDGTMIAFISLQSNQRKIVVQNYSDFRPVLFSSPNSHTNQTSASEKSKIYVQVTSFSPSSTTNHFDNSILNPNYEETPPHIISDSSSKPIESLSFSQSYSPTSNNYTSVPYKTDPFWLIPRTFVPISNQVSSKNARSIGLSLHSSDVLRKNTYALDLEYAEESIFYDLKYRYTGFFPAIQLNLNHTAYDPGNLIERDGLEFFGEQREYGFSTPMRFNIDHRNSSNSVVLIPEILNQSTRIRLTDDVNPINNQTTDWSGSNRIRLFSAYNYRLKQNIRSVGPVSGLILFYQSDVDINTRNTDLKPFSGHRTGLYFYSSPFIKQNHTLRLGIQSIIQNRFGYNTLNLIHEGFNYSDFSLADKNFTIFSTRYNIPLSYPDTGGILIPAYVENYYLTIFSESVLNSQFQHLDSVVGIGIRGRFRFFYNIVFDVGIGVAINPSIKGSETIVLNF